MSKTDFKLTLVILINNALFVFLIINQRLEVAPIKMQCIAMGREKDEEFSMNILFKTIDPTGKTFESNISTYVCPCDRRVCEMNI